ncbi:MAG: ribose-phosphate pyrophosphokinase [Candidatus Marinimicrobia bacterium]|nr:ribose-phosphate pyrophosphokinase [Candidatus Neomarinimicrobiota bacterium]
MKLFSGNANRPLAERIAAYLGEPLGEVVINRFPDGEIFVKIVENIRGRDVFILQPTCQPVNENLVEMLIMVDAARRASAARITAVMPYFGYGRQDRKDQPRVPITAKLVANLLVAAGVNRVLTMDLHAQQIQGFFDIPADHLYAQPVLLRHVLDQGWEKSVIVAPDPGSLKMAYSYANELNAEIAFAAKQRLSASEVVTANLVGDVEDRDCLLVDDMTATAGTLTAAARLLKERGARMIRAAVTHPILTAAACCRLQDSPIEELITTDSVPLPDCGGFPVSVLSVAELLGEAIMRTHNNQSVTSLFKLTRRKE